MCNVVIRVGRRWYRVDFLGVDGASSARLTARPSATTKRWRQASAGVRSGAKSRSRSGRSASPGGGTPKWPTVRLDAAADSERDRDPAAGRLQVAGGGPNRRPTPAERPPFRTRGRRGAALSRVSGTRSTSPTTEDWWAIERDCDVRSARSPRIVAHCRDLARKCRFDSSPQSLPILERMEHLNRRDFLTRPGSPAAAVGAAAGSGLWTPERAPPGPQPAQRSSSSASRETATRSAPT